MKKLFCLCLLLSSSVFASEIYQIEETDINGQKIKMENFKGRVLLIVNIASQCGFTSQLEGLQKIHDKYKEKGLVVIGVPTNDFGDQTPEADPQMKEFCSKKYGVNFPLFKKATIKGKEKRELYRFLTEQTSEEIKGEVGWNFVKFLINRQGKVVDRFTSFVAPDSDKVVKSIEKQL